MAVTDASEVLPRLLPGMVVANAAPSAAPDATPAEDANQTHVVSLPVQFPESESSEEEENLSPHCGSVSTSTSSVGWRSSASTSRSTRRSSNSRGSRSGSLVRASTTRVRDGVRTGVNFIQEDINQMRELAPADLTQVRQDITRKGTEMVRDLNAVKSILMSRKEQHEEDLEVTVSQVAALIDAPSEGPLTLPQVIEALYEAEVTFYGSPRRLLILQLALEVDVRAISPAKQILEIAMAAQGCADLVGATLVPLHMPQVTEAVIAMETEEFLGASDSPWWRRSVEKVLRALRITSPTKQRVDAFENHYGPGVELMFAWSAFYIQQLWLLVPFVLIWEFAQLKDLRKGRLRWLWEIGKVLVVLWSAWLAFKTTRVHLTPSKRKRSRIRTEDLVRDNWVANEPLADRLKRILVICFVFIPILAILVGIVAATMSGVTLLILRVIYVWGDCINLHSKDQVCRDAELKYSFIGWGAEVACDVFMAILFEVFFSLGSGVAAWMGNYMNYKHLSDLQLFREMLNIGLAAIERIGFVGSLAFLFAPQWVAPVCLGPEIDRLDLYCPCNDLAFGEADYRCLQRRLPVETRRWLFESLMKGPFIVAPFVSILIKVVVPKLAWQLSRIVDISTRCRCCCCMAPVRAVLRFVVLVFTYEGDNVKCFTYVTKGQPFGELPEDTPGRARLAAALHQIKLKPFQVTDEILELEMSLLWVTFFVPIMPRGVIFTLVAKLIEVNTDLTKMLFVRSRCFPADDRVLRREIIAFAWAVCVASIGWMAGLSLITYNDDLWKWGGGGTAAFFLMCFWVGLASLATVSTVNRLTAERRSHVAVATPASP